MANRDILRNSFACMGARGGPAEFASLRSKKFDKGVAARWFVVFASASPGAFRAIPTSSGKPLAEGRNDRGRDKAVHITAKRRDLPNQ